MDILERSEEMTEKEMDMVKRSTLYEVRLTIDEDPRENFTKEEVKKLLDEIALAKATK